MTRYSKTLVALIPAILALLKVLSDAFGDGVVSPQEFIAMAIAFLGALAVYVVPNTTNNPLVAEQESVVLRGGHAPLHHEAGVVDTRFMAIAALVIALVVLVVVVL